MPAGSGDTLWAEATHANALIDVVAWNPTLVPCFKLVSAPSFAVYRMDPHVVVFRASAVGCGVVGFSSPGAGAGFYSCASRVRLMVLDTPGNCRRSVGWVWGFSQQEKGEETGRLAVVFGLWLPRQIPFDPPGQVGWGSFVRPET